MVQGTLYAINQVCRIDWNYRKYIGIKRLPDPPTPSHTSISMATSYGRWLTCSSVCVDWNISPWAWIDQGTLYAINQVCRIDWNYRKYIRIKSLPDPPTPWSPWHQGTLCAINQVCRIDWNYHKYIGIKSLPDSPTPSHTSISMAKS